MLYESCIDTMITRLPDLPMRVTDITLNDFRGFREVQIPLHGRLNVFCGVNGSGKSTILDAIAIFLSRLANGVKTNPSGRPITVGSIHNEANFAKIALSGVFDGQEFFMSLVKSRPGYTVHECSDLRRIKEVIEAIRSGIERPPHRRLPLFAYYPINRPVLNISLKPKMKNDSGILEANEGALMGAANFRSFFEWFRSSEDIENEQYREAHSTKERQTDKTTKTQRGEYNTDTQLHAVREAISAFMPDFKHLIVRRKPLRMEVEKNGKTLQIDQLSDGEKCLMAMVGDIARRLAIANPNDKEPRSGSGIILIDEIDLHLHPQWQQMILPQLMKTFPNCQFIVSTHSPNVLTHVHPESLFLLSTRNNELTVDKPRTSYGRSVERILLDNMGLQMTRPKEIVKDLDNIYDWIEGSEFDKARKKIESLRSKIGDDPELVRSSALLKRKELIGK